jgi:hypothetical protein
MRLRYEPPNAIKHSVSSYDWRMYEFSVIKMCIVVYHLYLAVNLAASVSNRKNKSQVRNAF